MSQTKIDYSKSMIYKLCCKNSNITDIYIGSTTNFKMRKYQHKSIYNNVNSKEYNQYKYQFIRTNGGFENFDMILIENVNVDNKRDLEKIERDYIDKLKPSLNSVKSYITKDEKKQYKDEYKKEWYEKNKTEINEQSKIYREENKEKIKKQSKIYREENREKIKQNHKEKVNCQFCNSLITKLQLKRHQHTIKCQKFQYIED